MPNASSCAAAWRMMSQSLSLPITTPTCGAPLRCAIAPPGCGARVDVYPERAARVRGLTADRIATSRITACAAGCRQSARVADNGPRAPSFSASSSVAALALRAGARARRARAVGRRFPRGEGRVRARAAGAVRRARAEARRARARGLCRVLATVSAPRRRGRRRGAGVPRQMAGFAARRSAARRLSQGAGQARRLGARSARCIPPPAGEDVELACYGIQHRRQREGDAALARREAAVVHRAVDAGMPASRCSRR